MGRRRTITAGYDEFVSALKDLHDGVDSAAAQALYEAAGKMADAMNDAIEALEVETKYFHGTPNHPRKINPWEKEALRGSCGIASFRRTAFDIDTFVGMHRSGYAAFFNEKYVVPIELIARATETGTSFRKKQPFLRPCIKSMTDEVLNTIRFFLDRRFLRDIQLGKL